MKRLIYALTIVFAITSFTKAQAPYYYYHLERFQGDTVKYLFGNFDIGAHRYEGQKVEKLLNEYELPLTVVTPFSNYGMSIGNIEGIRLDYLTSEDIDAQLNNKEILGAVHIILRPPHISYQHFLATRGEDTPENNAWYFKDYIIDEVKIGAVWEPGFYERRTRMVEEGDEEIDIIYTGD